MEEEQNGAEANYESQDKELELEEMAEIRD